MRWFLSAAAASITMTSAAAQAEGQGRTTFACSGAVTFDVEQVAGGQKAVVRTPEGDFELTKKPSSLGQRYASPRATLIIDGDFAAFVTEQGTNFSECRAAPGADRLGARLPRQGSEPHAL